MEEIKILIVEDESIIALGLKDTLQGLNYIVTGTVKKEEDVLKNIDENKPHIILMDIDLNQKKNGIDIANKIYKTEIIPIIFLSGMDDESIIDEAIKTKPANYLTKPFNEIQLKTSIELVVNEYYKSEERLKDLGNDYKFDIKNKKLYYKDEIQKIGAKEIEFLNLLIEADGQVVLFETIENIVWREESVTGDAIRLLVSRLRKKLKSEMIETVYSHGFKIYIKK